ncbi:protein FAM217A-like [Trichosurus vulpecula]|uniref:protein FAM217A-like n=1 Tax=Trichosurus vulpecula TaxID=9337 RepID=UPI00186B200A|nr:protein FAM217A-like [Trichosurus vulpecula]
MTEKSICPRTSLGFLGGNRTRACSTTPEKIREGKCAQDSVEIEQHFNKMGETNLFCGIPGTHLPMTYNPHENGNHWNFESDVFTLESKNLPPTMKSRAGGRLKKIHLEMPLEQLKEFCLSENSHKKSQKDNKQEKFKFCSYPPNEAVIMQNKDFQKFPLETGFNVNNNRLRFILNHSLPCGSSFGRQADSYPGPQRQMSLSLHWPTADGDFCKDKYEPQSNPSSAPECNNDKTLFSSTWNAKCGKNSMEENLIDKSDLSEDENVRDILLNHFKKIDLNLRPEVIDDFEEPFSEQPNQVFSYPDFLPPPFNTLDLRKLALSKSKKWKLAFNHIEYSTEKLINRLLEMERKQHMTIQKERPKIPFNCSTPFVPE